jgi:hypothetical protein
MELGYRSRISLAPCGKGSTEGDVHCWSEMGKRQIENWCSIGVTYVCHTRARVFSWAMLSP